MKSISLSGCNLSADIEKTEKYYNSHTLCDCAGCRNFYAQIKQKLPELQVFLSNFGVDAERPDELSYYTCKNEIIYDSAYTVMGKIEKIYEENFFVGAVGITIDAQYVPNEQTEDYFVITAHDIRLPWILNEI